MRSTYWKAGEYNVICDSCGFKRKSGEVTERWDGVIVCRPDIQEGCWEPRHPQEFIKPMPLPAVLPWTRPEATDTYVTQAQVTQADRDAL